VGGLLGKEPYLCEVLLNIGSLQMLSLNSVVHKKEPYLCGVLA